MRRRMANRTCAKGSFRDRLAHEPPTSARVDNCGNRDSRRRVKTRRRAPGGGACNAAPGLIEFTHPTGGDAPCMGLIARHRPTTKAATLGFEALPAAPAATRSAFRPSSASLFFLLVDALVWAVDLPRRVRFVGEPITRSSDSMPDSREGAERCFLDQSGSAIGDEGRHLDAGPREFWPPCHRRPPLLAFSSVIVGD